MKICNKCRIEKEETEFYSDIRNKDGKRYDCKLCIKKYSRKYINDNKENIKERDKKYYSTNKKKCDDRNKNYIKKRILIDPIFKNKINIRSLIKNGLRKNGFSKKSRTHEILGCSYEEFKLYIENQFENWMNWSNQGVYTGNYNETWQLDHIIPISSAKNEEEVIKLNHYTNFQPLCSRRNLEKKNTLLLNI